MEECRDLLNHYQQIADKDDTSLTDWQRQVRVSKFMLETQARKMVLSLVSPVIESQTHIERTLTQQLQKQISSLSERLEVAESDLYIKAERNDRLAGLNAKLLAEEHDRKLAVMKL